MKRLPYLSRRAPHLVTLKEVAALVGGKRGKPRVMDVRRAVSRLRLDTTDLPPGLTVDECAWLLCVSRGQCQTLIDEGILETARDASGKITFESASLISEAGGQCRRDFEAMVKEASQFPESD